MSDKKQDQEKHRKFDVIIGNPPYQEETSGASERNGQKSVKNIFQLFQEQADHLATEYVSMIYPGGRWIQQSGKGMKNFGLKQINDPHLEKVTFYPDANEIFDKVGISDGISIVVKDMHKTTPGFKYVYSENGKSKEFNLDNPGEQILPLDPDDLSLVNKIAVFIKKNSLKYLHDAILPRSLFDIESSFVEDNPDKIHPFTEKFDETKYVKLFSNDKAGKAGRATWFLVDLDAIQKNRKYISQYQVVVSSANAGGQKRDNQISIMDNHSAFGRSRVALRSFNTLKEAQNFMKYANSKVIKYTFLLTDEALSSLAKWVPDVLDYSDNNKLIDFSENIDAQLCDLIGFDKDDYKYIVKRVNNVRSGN